MNCVKLWVLGVLPIIFDQVLDIAKSVVVQRQTERVTRTRVTNKAVTKCNECEIIVQSFTDLSKHKKLFHAKISSSSLVTSLAKKNVVKKKTTNKDVPQIQGCKTSDKDVISKPNQGEHLNNKQTNTNHADQEDMLLSDMKFPIMEILENLLDDVTNKRTPRIECSHCGKSYQRVHMLKKHIESNHENRKSLNTSTVQPAIVIVDTVEDEHIERVPENVENVEKSSDLVKCLRCEEMFLDTSNLQKHINTNHGENLQPTLDNTNLSQDVIDQNKREIEDLKNQVKEQNEIMKKKENEMLLKIKELENESKVKDKSHKKNIKQLEGKVVMLGNTIKNYVIELDKQVQLKEKYAEEKKTLTNIIKNHIMLKDLKIDLQHVLSVENDDNSNPNQELLITSENEWEDIEPDETNSNGFVKVINKRKKRMTKQRKTLHQNRTITEKVSCTKCGEKFDNSAELNTHVAKHISKLTFECEDCKHTFAEEKNLKDHIKTSHKSVIPIKCQLCKFSTAKQVDFLLHMESHNSDSFKNNFKPRRKVCRWFLSGTCRFGKDCRNIHRAPPQCIFKSKCRAWPQCKFGHYEVCKDNQACFDQNCKLEHPSKPFLGSNCPQKTPNINSHLEFPPIMKGSRLY